MSERDISDKLDSLHRRMDKFYEWAAILQKEFRDMRQWCVSYLIGGSMHRRRTARVVGPWSGQRREGTRRWCSCCWAL